MSDTTAGLFLVPLPAAVAARDGADFRLGEATRLAGDLDTAAAFADLVAVRTGIRLAEPAARADGADTVQFRLEPQRPGGAESYAITVDATSVAVVSSGAAGLFYGAQTLAQLLAGDEEGGWVIPAVEIADAPRFAYRGVMLDVARHFFPVETVCTYIDRAAELKLNHLHLHLTDDQGWRLEIRSRPELTAKAAGTAVGGGAGGFYTQQDYAAIVAHAASRHMTVVPEIDVPSHTHAIGLAYPEITEAPVITDTVRENVAQYGGDLPAAGEPYTGFAVGFSSLKTDDEATYDFLADVLGELAAITPGPYLHIGGDECLGTDPDDFAVFIARVTELVANLGKTPLAWHEAGAAPEIAPSTIGQYWGFVSGADADNAAAFARGGSQLILSPADAVYLDMKRDPDGPLGLTWANGATSVERSYRWEPADVIDGVGEADILGVEAPLWTETVRTLADIEALAFPRIAAAAEAAWSPATGTHPDRTWASFRTRLAARGPAWQAAGIGFDRSPEIDWTGA
ncbi:beta-N-acetylhexosaminidase [Microbacterium sp. zg-YB36]|uniref:beta-N-acetylhexosaminidase n=1 Tax=Microbacterium sp. zg-YB36 TaxID=2969407 RepID=UPI00214CCAA4|nr:beta-N-acetylhexosaminidase [Microbacterium sp. zg-YB36]MDL5352484.1 beta-N-acetylhexosaminidase [Microbacterium sp. zg-YB36]